MAKAYSKKVIIINLIFYKTFLPDDNLKTGYGINLVAINVSLYNISIYST